MQPISKGSCWTPDVLQKLRNALTNVCTDPALAQTRGDLLLDGAALLDDDDYERVIEMEQRAIEQGYPALD